MILSRITKILKDKTTDEFVCVDRLPIVDAVI